VLHGVRRAPDGRGAIGVRVFATGDALRLQRARRRPRCDPAAPFADGKIGVTNTRARLEVLYRNTQSFRFVRDGAAFVADISIPLRFP
jgi:hypothetical protein